MADPLGVSIAFSDPWSEPDPTWTRIDTLAGINVSGWTIDRGRPTEFDKTGTGTAVVRGFDTVGAFDPTNIGGDYFGSLNPGKQAAIALRDPVLDTWHTLFRGFVEEWSFTLDQTRRYFEFEIQLVDGFALMSGWELQPGVHGLLPLPAWVADGNVFYENTVGGGGVRDRLEAILEDFDWPDARSNLNTGNVSLGDKVYGAGTSALAALQDAADGEFPGVANLYMDKEGILTFHGRQPRFRPDVAEYGINERDVGDPSATDLDDDVVPVSELSFNRGKSTLRNACLVYPERPEGADFDLAGQFVKDDTSIAAYGLQSVTFDNLQTLDGLATGNTDLEETALFGAYYVTNYKDPQTRVSRMVFKSRDPGSRLGPSLFRMLCRAEISDKLNLKTEHPGGGGFDESFYIEGLHYAARAAGADVAAGEALPFVTLDVDVSSADGWSTNPFDADPDPGP